MRSGRGEPVAWLRAYLLLMCAAGQALLAQQRHRLCVVHGDDHNRAIVKQCTLLKGGGSRVECVFGNSRLDCLRLIMKNEADFGIFQPEDLLVASKDRAGDFVVTHYIQTLDSEYDYKMVVLVRAHDSIHSLRDLKDRNLCHPGRGYEIDWTEVEGKFFEERVVPQMCDSELPVHENFIKSSATFFKAACIAGPWVPDSKMDTMLKNKYNNLCSLCDRPKVCNKFDKYWGRTGPLYCLTDGYGEVAWARLDDTLFHFGITSDSNPVADPMEYAFLCEDGTKLPLNSSKPCTWLDRPLSVIMARRTAAIGVQKLVASLKSHSGSNWQEAAKQILDAVRLNLIPLSSAKIPEDYLRSASGFLSANSIVHCERILKLCISSSLENAKCNWISEAAKANGIKPYIRCEEQNEVEKCLEDVHNGVSDAVLVDNDYLAVATRKYNLTSVLYEYVNSNSNTYKIVAVTLATSSIRTLEDMKNKKACFSQYDSAGWNTAVYVLKGYNLLPSICPNSAAMAKYFSGICVPELMSNYSNSEKFNKNCEADPTEQVVHKGEQGALECLRSGKGDVAFVSINTLLNASGIKNWPASQNFKEFVLVCPASDTEDCTLSRSLPGQIMVKSDISTVKLTDLKIVLEYMSNMFGRNHKKLKPIFKSFGVFDGHKNIIFHDETECLKDMYFTDKSKPSYEDIVRNTNECSRASSTYTEFLPFLSSIFLLIRK